MIRRYPRRTTFATSIIRSYPFRMFTYDGTDFEGAGWVADDFWRKLTICSFRAKVTLITSLFELISVFSNRPRLLFFRPTTTPISACVSQFCFMSGLRYCDTYSARPWQLYVDRYIVKHIQLRPLAVVWWMMFSKHSPATVVRDMIAWTYAVWM